VANTTAVNSHVTTSGDDAGAGIGDGAVGSGGTVANTTAVNSFVNGNKKNFGSISYDQLLCQADQSVSTAAKEPTAAAAATVSTDATASTAATVGGITTGSLLAGGLGLGIAGYSTYQWITGYWEGLLGQKLAMKPLTRGRELASAAINSVSQSIQGIRERMNRQSVSKQELAHEMSQVQD
ncbi:hypothetical protein, partial [Endozoicomonas acroporae]|uniref:hypothetical protein n=1 Tax=Endozoicomonas acroporae TaxID=1701104 RepID=UPI001C608863